MRRQKLIPAVLVGLGVASSARGAATDFRIVTQSVSIDRANTTADFVLQFDTKPNFSMLDGNQTDAFQYEIDTDTNNLSGGINFNDIDTVIRGGEIFEGDGIPVRTQGGDGGAQSGGWGPVRAFLPFKVDGNTLKFSAPLSALGDTDGKFRYRLFSTEQGALTGQTVGAVIPLPPAIYSGAALLAFWGITRRARIFRLE